MVTIPVQSCQVVEADPRKGRTNPAPCLLDVLGAGFIRHYAHLRATRPGRSKITAKLRVGSVLLILTIACALALLAAPALAGPARRPAAGLGVATRAFLPLAANRFSTAYTYRIGVRVVNGTGEFYDRATGLRFVPRGNNYIRLGPQKDPSGETVIYHSTFDPGAYDPARVEAAFQRMHADGYNVVRVFLSQNTILKDGQFDAIYIANVVDLLRRVRANGLYVMTTMDWLPGGRYGDIQAAECCELFNFNNLPYLSASGLRANQAFFDDFVRALMAAGAPLDAVFAYELRNELFYDTNYPPLSLTSGTVRTANGKTYNMAVAADKRLMVDENLPYWIDGVRAAIHAIDSTALVGVGFFEPQEPNPSRVGDPRLASTRPAIWLSQADFIDLHTYPGFDLTLPQYVQNFGMDGMRVKPIIMGEFGAFTAAYASAAAGAQALQDWQVASCAYGFDGWLLWTWDTDEQPELWNGLSQNGVINNALARQTHPDPCAGSPFPGQNVALRKPATASRSLPTNPPAMAVDGASATWWGAGAFATQWIEINLEGAYDIAIIRLVPSQSPAGQTLHRVLGRSASGAYRVLREFSGVTQDGQALEYSPPLPWTGIQYVRVETTTSPSWVSWREVEVISIEN
jgi:hypothetical protein